MLEDYQVTPFLLTARYVFLKVSTGIQLEKSTKSLYFPKTWRFVKQRKLARTTSSSCKIQDLYFGTYFGNIYFGQFIFDR